MSLTPAAVYSRRVHAGLENTIKLASFPGFPAMVGGAGNEGILNMLASFPGRSAIKNGRRERPGNEAACAKCMHYMHAAPGRTVICGYKFASGLQKITVDYNPP